MNFTTHLPALTAALAQLESAFAQQLPESEPIAFDRQALEKLLSQLAGEFTQELPYFHPMYAGQMIKAPHPVAMAAYMLTMHLNPNNHALDGGRLSSQLEKSAVAALATMFAWPEHLGHLTSGGTIANLEAHWVARQLRSGATTLASAQAHFTHERMSGLLQVPFETVAADSSGRIDLAHLEARLQRGDVGLVVATIGTTAIGAVDALEQLCRLREKYDFRLHADAAYGGYFTLAGNLRSETRRALDALAEVDSLVIDPHKHGLQPYGCGCILLRDPSLRRLYKHDSPYTYFSSSTELHLGEISLECSRPGAAAVALWATQQLLPMQRGGEFAHALEACRGAAVELHLRLVADERFWAPLAPELDIVAWLPRAASASEASLKSRQLYEAAARRGLHLALVQLPVAMLDPSGERLTADQPRVTALRCVLLKPSHQAWLERLYDELDRAASEVGL